MAVTQDEIDALVAAGEDPVDATQFATSFDVMWQKRIAELPTPLTMEQILAAIPVQRPVAQNDEALAGTRNDRDMTPLRVKAVLDARLAELPAGPTVEAVTASLMANQEFLAATKGAPGETVTFKALSAVLVPVNQATGDPEQDAERAAHRLAGIEYLKQDLAQVAAPEA